MYYIIGADVVPTKSNIELFKSGDVKGLVGNELMDILDNASYRIFNLECPLTDEESPIIKCGPNLIAPIEAVNGYKALGVDLLTLANNHILDQNVQGLKSTEKTLDDAGITHTGTGNDPDAAAKPFIFDFNGKRVGVYACAEHEFSIVQQDRPGANPFDPLFSLDHVAELKHNSDFLIVLYHGGKEHYRYPSPLLQRICRRLVDKGADLVICQHSHCIGCEEKYKEGTIVYGQGNFIFDDSNEECWQTSLLVKIEDDFSVSYIPLAKTGNGVRLADAARSKDIMDNFYARSAEIQSLGFVEKKYAEFADSYLNYYLRALSGKQSLLFRGFNKLSSGLCMKLLLRSKYGAMEKVRIVNYLDCEAHRELLLQMLEKSI